MVQAVRLTTCSRPKVDLPTTSDAERVAALQRENRELRLAKAVVESGSALLVATLHRPGPGLIEDSSRVCELQRRRAMRCPRRDSLDTHDCRDARPDLLDQSISEPEGKKPIIQNADDTRRAASRDRPSAIPVLTRDRQSPVSYSPW